ncbi:MAG: hypothetical protein J6A25_09780 [Lachnospiraceae bacterium]|nr:hypothetical protein [Lachnospiraceae bacterium]
MKRLKKFRSLVLLLVCAVVCTMIGMVSKAEAIPRIIISGYSSVPEDIKAGDTFTLTLHIENKSTKTAVTNMKLSLSTVNGEFYPASGSGVIYIEKIAAGESTDVSIEMKAKGSLETDTYGLTVTTEYEDRYSAVYQDVTTLSIPVSQVANVSITEKSISSEEIAVGKKANIMFAVNNQGKSSIYNVNVKITGKGIDESTYFLGNVQSGATGYVDMLIVAKETNQGEETIKAQISFEDSEGNAETVEEIFELSIVEEGTVDDVAVDEEGAAVVVKSDMTTILVPIIAVAVVVIIVVIVLVNKAKKKKEEDEDEI